MAGTAYGARSPVGVCSPTLYVAATLEAGATLPLPDEHPERAIYVRGGGVGVGGRRLAPGAMAVFHAGPPSCARWRPSRCVLIGGAPVDGERHIWWNFVASSPERIERAKRDWRSTGASPSSPATSTSSSRCPEEPVPAPPPEDKVTFNP